MNYIKKTLEYLFVLEKGKRFIVLFLLALPVGLATAFAAPGALVYKWLSSFTVGDKNFWHAWCFNGVLDPVTIIVSWAVAIALMLFFFSVMSTVVSRSMRVGIFKMKGIFREFNENFFPVMAATLMYFVIVLVIKALMTALLTLFQTLHDPTVAAAASAVTGILAYALLCFMATIGILYLPFMVQNGLRSFHAFTASASKISGKLQLKMFVAIFLPVSLLLGIGVGIGVIGNAIVSVIVETALYALVFTYVIALSFVSYYEILGLTREDYTREYFYYKPKRRS